MVTENWETFQTFPHLCLENLREILSDALSSPAVPKIHTKVKVPKTNSIKSVNTVLAFCKMFSKVLENPAQSQTCRVVFVDEFSLKCRLLSLYIHNRVRVRMQQTSSTYKAP